jgi:hypothetical protein
MFEKQTLWIRNIRQRVDSVDDIVDTFGWEFNQLKIPGSPGALYPQRTESHDNRSSFFAGKAAETEPENRSYCITNNSPSISQAAGYSDSKFINVKVPVNERGM